MSELRTNRIVPRDGLTSGSYGGIIQVRYGSSTTQLSSTSTSFDDGLVISLTITPNRADSAILLMLTFNGNQASGGSGLNRFKYNISRTVGGTSTSLVTVDEALVDYGTSNIHVQGLGNNYLDTGHGTTSEITYKFSFASSHGGQVQINNNGRSDLIAMEIAG